MTNLRKWSAAAAAAIAAVVALALVYVFLASEAEISRRYTLPSSILKAEITPQAIARGAHLAAIFGCRDCHGPDLKGRMLYSAPDLPIFATDLRAFAKSATDEDFDRAVRHGLTRDARAVWVMPTDSYFYMSNDDLADIIAYIRSLGGDNAPSPTPQFGIMARLAIVKCELQPASPYTLGMNSPINVGPRWDGGRYLSAIGCSQCHGGDLGGSADGKIPGLSITANYSRNAFFHLMHGGAEKSGRLTQMSSVAGARFSALHDYEADALYDYLVERARVLKVSPPVPAPQPHFTQTLCPPAHRKPPN